MFRLFSPKELYIGIDLGSYYIKVVDVDVQWSDIKNLKSFRVKFANKILVKDVNNDKDVIVSYLNDLLGSYIPKNYNVKVIACLSSPNIIVRTIEVPKKVNVDKEKLEIARDYIPYKVEDCKIEMHVINEDIPESPDKKEVLLIAFLLQDYVALSDIIDSLKFERVAIEFDELGVWRLLEGANYNNFRDSDNIVIDLGYLSTKIMVFNRGKLKQLRILRVGGEELKNLFVEKLNMTDFENVFHTLSFSEANYLSVLTKFFEPIIKELKRTIISYKSKFSFSNIYLIGGLSYISGVNEFLSKELSIPVVCINLENFKNIAKIDKKIENTFKDEFNLYVNALGLALGHGQRKFAL